MKNENKFKDYEFPEWTPEEVTEEMLKWAEEGLRRYDEEHRDEYPGGIIPTPDETEKNS